MFTSRIALALGGVLSLVAGAARADDAAPHFGQDISQSDLQAWDISILPDGTGLPEGSGTPAQGEKIFSEKCVACHGEKGAGGVAKKLVGGIGTLKAPGVPDKTVGSFFPYATTLFDFTRRAMPWDHPKTLSNDEVYAVSAYVLKMNGIIKDNEVMNKTTLPKVKMPNRDGFINRYPEVF